MDFILLMALSLLLGCNSKTPTPAPLPVASPTAMVDSLGTLETALEHAAVSFELQGGIEAADGLQGRRYRVNGEIVLALQAPEEMAMEQASAAFADFAAAMGPGARFWQQERLAVFYAGKEGGLVLLLSGLLGDVQSAEPPPQDEPYPPAVSAAIGALSGRLEVDPAEIKVESFSPVTWPNGCLGLPETGEDCADEPVSGWQVQLEAADQFWLIRTDQVGDRIRIE
ncbi:MAG: hypothetical protein ACLFWD_10995 [Anaerolineales bacterium]